MMVYHLNHYVINWDKVKTLEDLIRILKVVNISFEHYVAGLDDIKDLLILQDKPTNNLLGDTNG